MPMKLYEVALKRVSFTTYVVEALDENHAEEEAWKLLEPASSTEGSWSLESVEPYEP